VKSGLAGNIVERLTASKDIHRPLIRLRKTAIRMHLPSAVEFTDGDARYADEGLYLHGYSPDGESVSVQIRQRNLPELEYAGRLYVDGQLIETRSPDEAAVLTLLANATFAAEPDVDVRTHVGSIIGREPLMRLRDKIVAYVESEEYLKIAKNGVKKTFVPWRGF
jgi:hypothetical protein